MCTASTITSGLPPRRDSVAGLPSSPATRPLSARTPLERGPVSWYASAWAEKAPVGTVYERAILTYLAHRARKDGTNCYPSTQTLANFALCDKRTAQRHLDAMIERGLVAEGDQEVVQHLRADRRPTVYDILVPHSWYSDDQLEDVNEDRAERGLPPLSPEARPRLTSPPKPGRSERSDKGQKNPKRRPATGATSNEADSTDTGRLSDTPPEAADNPSRGDSQTPREEERDDSQTPGRGVSLPPETVPGETPPKKETPPPCTPPETASVDELPQPSNEGGGEAPQKDYDELARQFFRSALEDVPKPANQPSTDDKHRLVSLLKDCWQYGYGNAEIRSELLDGLGTVKHLGKTWIYRLQRLMEQRTAQETAKPQVPDVCGQCDGRPGEPMSTRIVWHGDTPMAFDWCPRCHPKGRTGSVSSISDAPSAPSAAS